MSHRITRTELYDLVWSKPMAKVAEQFDVSSPTLTKVCERMSVPVPPRGYWMRKSAGKTDVRIALPIRPPGLDEETIVGGGYNWRYQLRLLPPPEELLGPVPPEPAFDEPIENVRERVEQAMRKVSVPKTLDQPHPVVAKLLKSDDARREKAKQWGYMSSMYPIRYDSPIQRRRLRLLSAVFLSAASVGCRADTWGSEPYDKPQDEFCVRVGDQSVRLSAAVVEARHRTGKGADAKITSEERLRYVLNPGERADAGERIWEDEEERRLESAIREIAVAIVVMGEEVYRAGALNAHRWRVQAREELIERRRKEREEADRRERERQAELTRQRVERLLAEADALRRAVAIRQYVQEAREANAGLSDPVPDDEFAAWAEWALVVADGIDPVRSGAFREGVPARVVAAPRSVASPDSG